MRELVRTNDPVLLSFLTALLKDYQMTAIVADQYTSVMEGSIGAIPRRLLIADEDYHAARRLIADAGYGEVLHRPSALD